MKAASETGERWLAHLFSIEPADRPHAQSAVRDLYAAAGFEPPRYLFWFESPFDACWANALLTAPHSMIWQRLLDGFGQVKAYRENLNRVRAALCKSAAEGNWETLLAAVGPPMGSRYDQRKTLPAGTTSIQMEILKTRFALYGDAPPTNLDESNPLVLAEKRFFSPNQGVLCCQMRDRTVNSFLSLSFFLDYSFSKMADDEQQVGGNTPPPILAAAWAIARSSGPWWPYAHAALMTDRPAEMHLNTRSLPHRGDGPAALYRDGSPVYAWNGTPLPARWILQQETLTARELKEFDADFREYVEARAGTPKPKAVKRKKPSVALKLDLPNDHTTRLEQLRRHNKGSLPLFDRYATGEHEKVWKELVALGPTVREDPHAADALAVAYETMRRVEENVRTVTARLRAMNYAFKTGAGRVDDRVQRAEDAMRFAQTLATGSSTSPHVRKVLEMMEKVQGVMAGQIAKSKEAPRDETGRAHVPPGPQARKHLARLEKIAGTLPLSLRVFYEVVGAVDWMGRHPKLAPESSSICADPLVVFPLEEALEECQQRMEDEGETFITIAPDELHKADTSGGEPYEIAVPDLCADAELLNERHQLLFVDYLRLCFRFGGFPGYDGYDRGVPSEIESLRESLLAF